MYKPLSIRIAEVALIVTPLLPLQYYFPFHIINIFFLAPYFLRLGKSLKNLWTLDKVNIDR